MLRILLLIALLVPGPALAQGAETLADMRQELQVLFVEVQKLKRELSTTGGPRTNLSGTSALDRIDAMEAELRRLTGLTEELENRINRVVGDGTNRIGDLRFRICEMEAGCDISELGETPPLGGVETPEAAQPRPVTEGAELAVGEQQDFDRAKAAYDEGDYGRAAELLDDFTDTYTGGPLTGEAQYLRGEALSEMGEDTAAARAYLDAFSGQPQGPRAAQALLQLGRKLGELGQEADACATLGEVPARFPGSSEAAEAETARGDLGCS